MKNKFAITESSENGNDLDIMQMMDRATNNFILWPEAENVNHPVAKFSNNSLRAAKKTIPYALPSLTKAGVEMTREGNSYGVGVPFTIFGVIADVVKWPFVLLAAGAEAGVGGTAKLISKIFKKNLQAWELNRFNVCFMKSLNETAQLIVDLQLESIDDLKQQIESEQDERLIALTCLQIAYVSRHYADGILLVSTKEKLTLENCPEDAAAIFEKIMKLKGFINQAIAAANIDKKHSYYINEEAKLFAQWFRVIHAGFELEAANILQKSDIQQAETIMKIIDELVKNQASVDVDDDVKVRMTPS